MAVPVLVEGFVVASVAAALTEAGWKVITVAATYAQGVDITATKGTARLLIEAKGAGSSRVGSQRYGKSFSQGQVESCVGKALFKAMGVATPDLAAIAFPDTPLFRTKLSEAHVMNLTHLGIVVFWVTENGSVTLEPDLGYLTA